jgi:ABC-type uncharacterized transport system substrate-binding protein
MGKQRPDGLYVSGAGAVLRANRKRVVGFALKSRLPSVYENREAVDAGGLMYYGADFAESNRRVAAYVDKILKGAKPADLPVEQPTKFELVINLKTAKQMAGRFAVDVVSGGQGDSMKEVAVSDEWIKAKKLHEEKSRCHSLRHGLLLAPSQARQPTKVLGRIRN